jgi:hypothetical protein
MKATAFRDLTVRKPKPKLIKYILSKHAVERIKERWHGFWKIAKLHGCGWNKTISALINSSKPFKMDEDGACYGYGDYIIVVRLGTNVVKTVKPRNKP